MAEVREAYLEPTRRGKYQYIARIGHGGMADVFLALARGPLGFDKLVVIKQLRSSLADDLPFRQMFIDEARIAGLLNHSNIVQTIEVGEYDGASIIAMEYLDGQPLDNIADESKSAALTLKPLLCAQIASDVLAGLHYAHELTDYGGSPLGIVHRDVSPQNIFITYEGHVKLLDFGVAKAASRLTHTEVGTVKGKPSYMPPEQMDGEDVDRRADIYAVGVVLWELLTLERCFPAGRRGEVPPLGERVPGPLAAIVARATRQRKNERFKTAADMRDELEAFIANTPREGRRDELAHIISALFHEAREKRRARIRHQLAGIGPNDTDPSLDKLPMLASDSANAGATRVDRPPSTPPKASTVTTSGNLTADVPDDIPRTVPDSPSVRGTIASRVVARRAVWPVLAGALVLGGVAALVVLPRLHGRSAAATPIAPPTTAAPSGEGPEIGVRLCGSYTLSTELMPSLVEAFLRGKGVDKPVKSRAPGDWRWTIAGAVPDKPHGLGIELAGEGTSTAFDGLASGHCDIGMASRRIHPDEAGKLRDKGFGDMTSPANEHVIALEGIAIVVHPNNPVRALTLAQVRDLFTANVADWSKVGGQSGPVHLYARDDESATYENFKQLVLGGGTVAASTKRFPINDSLSDAVASDPAGVGFVGLNHVRGAKPLAVSEPDSPPIYPSRFTVATEDYPLMRRLYLYTSQSPTNPATRDFVSFALSTEGQAIVKNAGFIDLNIWMRDAREAEDNCQGGCPPRYLKLIEHARRLSLDFRFQPGKVDLDSRAFRDLDRVVAFLSTLPEPRVLLFGFSDRAEDAKDKLTLSRDRAKRVAEELGARGVHAAIIEGFGDAIRLSSGAHEAAGDRSRRVEIWVEARQ